ncbi:succinyl-CoA synthetase-like protein, partial [Mycena rosella]
RVIFQGFTRKEAIEDAMKAVAWETHVVGGVTPGRDGMHPMLDTLPVFLTVSAAVRRLKPDGTAIYGPPDEVAAAIEEASNRGRNSAHCASTGITHGGHVSIYFMLQSQSKSRLLGGSMPGILSPSTRFCVGFQPFPCFMPGSVGIVAKSRRLTYEVAALLTRAGLGQSFCIVGGNVVVGTGFVDALDALEQDPDTDSIIVIGDHQGRAEEIAAEWTQDYRNRIGDPK